MPKASNNNLAGQQQERNSSVIHASVKSVEMYSGPIPPARGLAKYEQILPGSANRILEMAEEQSRHRRKMESKMLDASIKSERAGQLFGFTVFSLAIVVGFVLVLIGKDVLGLVSLITAVGGIVGLFVYNRKDMRKELGSRKTKKGER